MSTPLDELYFVWLYRQVGDPEVKNPARTHWRLLKQLYTKEFIWIIPNDDNRLADGKDLRQRFVDEEGLKDVDPDWMRIGCSMLELFIGLSERLAFEAEGEPRDWFWHLIENIGLNNCNDHSIDKTWRYPHQKVDDALDRVIWRTYSRNGEGGLFPLNSHREDQRIVELWYQLGAYVLEKGMV